MEVIFTFNKMSLKKISGEARCSAAQQSRELTQENLE